MNSDLTAERLRELLDYDPISGEFRVKLYRGGPTKMGEVAGRLDGSGYRQIMVDGIRYRASRLAWLWVLGTWPVGEIDHINRVRDDDRFSNLRDVDRAENIANRGVRKDSQTGIAGVSFRAGRWHAAYKKKHLGTFKSAFAAKAAYEAAKMGRVA